jgi:hypothetical protein
MKKFSQPFVSTTSSSGINPATELVIPAAAERRAGIQKRPCSYWIPTFAGMTEGILSILKRTERSDIHKSSIFNSLAQPIDNLFMRNYP